MESLTAQRIVKDFIDASKVSVDRMQINRKAASIMKTKEKIIQLCVDNVEKDMEKYYDKDKKDKSMASMIKAHSL